MREKDRKTSAPEPVSRRRFIALSSAALAMPLLSRLPAWAAPEPLPPDRSLSFFNIHTNESLSTEYCRSGCLIAPSLERIDYILRDDRVGEVKKIDIRLLDLLHTLDRKIAAEQPYHVISGYRSPQTNAYLREHGHGVAEHSLHLLGQAIDIRVPGVKLMDVYRTAVALRLGGVGLYPASDFVHVDVGPVRTW
jgi:uncharacterized protein YcbK (DUF882 family)